MRPTVATAVPIAAPDGRAPRCGHVPDGPDGSDGLAPTQPLTGT